MASNLVVVIYSMVSMVMISHKVKGTGVPVVCVFSKTCVLPCSFTAGEELVLHWMFGPDKDQTVHSYYDGQNQLSHQDLKFKSRTSLFDEDLSGGNGSLRLTDVKIKDQGQYKCYTNTNSGTQDTFVDLTIEAPVRSVDIRLSDEVLTCSSEAIYPLPKLTWSASPPLGSQPPFSSEKDAQGFYNIHSSLRIMGNNTGVEYVCSVSSNTVTRTGTLTKQAPVESSHKSTASISCRLANPLTFNLEWRFNHSELILTLSSEEAEPQIQGLWKDQVESSPEPGTLRLRELKQSHQGTYTCDLRSAGNRYVSVTDLKILPEAKQDSAWWIGLVVGLGFLLAVGLFYYFCCRKDTSGSNGTDKEQHQSLELMNGCSPSNEMSQMSVDLSHPVTSTDPLMTKDSQDIIQHMDESDG